MTASLRRAEESLARFAEQLTVEVGACGQDIDHLSGHLSEVRWARRRRGDGIP